MERLFKVPEFAQFIGVSESTAWRLVLDGTVPSHKIGKSRRVAESDVHAMLAASRQVAGRAVGAGVQVGKPGKTGTRGAGRMTAA